MSNFNNLASEDPTLIVTPNPSTVLDEKPVKDDVKIDLRDNLSPHNDPSNPFAFTHDQMSALLDPKNLPLLRSFGGLEGVARGLHVDLQSGLTPNAPNHQPISLDQVRRDEDDSVIEDVDFKRSNTVQSLGRQMTHRTDATVPTPDVTAFPQRKAVFGANVLPETQSKSIFRLMWIAFQDKTLVKIFICMFFCAGTKH